MPAALTVLEAVLAAIVLGLLLALLLTYARRQAITRGRAVFLCGLREKGDAKFQQGLASLDGGALAWFRLNGVSVRSTRRWDRPRLEFSGASPISAPELASILSRPLLVRCQYENETFDLALGDASYTALRSWVESMPPGHNVNVA